ncbi:MAG TPA: hypothetical protein DEB24_00470 [Coriobacteriia bacterium]|nr:hypothetical protein [Coriobacteriia bacterium]
MIFCPNCSSAAFDDMEICYVCMGSLKADAEPPHPDPDFDLDLSFLEFDPIVEEPTMDLQFR